MRTIVTGGNGFIGSHLTESLISQGVETHVVDTAKTNLTLGAKIHYTDVRNLLTLKYLKPDVIYHLAAQADVGRSVQYPEYDMVVNIGGMIAVLRMAQETGAKVVFTSTGGAIYGECADFARESDTPQPMSPYAVSKLCAEQYAALWERLYGVETVVCRLGNVYGPRQKSSLEGGVVARFFDAMNRGEDTQIFGDGLQTRDFVYVKDVVSALHHASLANSGVYNVGTGYSLSIADIHELCSRISGNNHEAEYLDARLGDVRHSKLSCDRAETELEWTAETSLEEGLTETWNSPKF